MKTSHQKRTIVIALAAVVLLVFSWGVVQYRQMSNLTYQIYYPEDSYPQDSPGKTYTVKDTLFGRSSTEFSEYLKQLKFTPCDDDFYKMDLDSNDAIEITVEDGSVDLVNSYSVFEQPNQYIVFDVEYEKPDQYAVVRGQQYEYLHQKLSKGREGLEITSQQSQK